MIISKTPLRASLFGGGSDFKAYFENSVMGYGSVLSAGLNMHVYITVNKKFDDKIRVVYNGNENVNSLDEVKHNIIREALRLVGIERGIEVIYMADIPMSSAGIGLASSSALAVGVLNALHAFKGEFVTPKQLAREACFIEIEKLGQRIGIQDQYAVAHGGLNRYRFMNDGTVSVTPGIIDTKTRERLIGKLMLFYTGNTRLANGDIDCVGSELDRTWMIKKQLAGGISNPDIDSMYDIARSNGAIGGKILGAGGGGFMLLYVPEEKQESVRKGLRQFREVDFNIDYQGSRIIFVD